MTDKTNLSSKLADLKLFQNVLIECGDKLMKLTDDETIQKRLSNIISTDRDNLSTIEEAISKFGSPVESREITQKHAQKVRLPKLSTGRRTKGVLAIYYFEDFNFRISARY